MITLMSSSDDKSYKQAFETGEWFKLRIHYGIINAGYATMEVKEKIRNNRKMHYVVGYGQTVGLTKLFFEVEDHYQSIFDKETGKPYQFLRKINEGGYKKYQEGFFNHKEQTVLLKDHQENTQKTFTVPENVQDVVSSFYYLRNHPKVDQLNINESIEIKMFFDDELLKFQLKYLGKEELSTKFGKIMCLKFRPMVLSGRVFKEEESLTVWVSEDQNKIPIRIKAELAVGSLKADLDDYRGLKHTIKFIDN